MATSLELPIHLPVFPSTERHSQEACDEHQRSIWTSHSLAPFQTQVHTAGSQRHLGFGKIPTPLGTLDYHPRLGIKHKSTI
jgi:hypothetical protein